METALGITSEQLSLIMETIFSVLYLVNTMIDVAMVLTLTRSIYVSFTVNPRQYSINIDTNFAVKIVLLSFLEVLYTDIIILIVFILFKQLILVTYNIHYRDLTNQVNPSTNNEFTRKLLDNIIKFGGKTKK